MMEITIAQAMDAALAGEPRPNTSASRIKLAHDVEDAIAQQLEAALGYPAPVRIVPIIEAAGNPSGIALVDLKIMPRPEATDAAATMFSEIPKQIDRLLKQGRIVHMLGIFAGQDGSMGFKRGRPYNLTIQQEQGRDIMLRTEGHGIRRECPYATVDTLLQNWRAVRTWSGSRDGGDAHGKE